jgi:uncharacterized protein VirK/YbjX
MWARRQVEIARRSPSATLAPVAMKARWRRWGFWLLATLLVAMASAPAARAQQSYDWQYQSDRDRQEFSALEQFLTAHTWIAGKLRDNPSLANSRDFLNENGELRRFLNAHPFVQAGLKQDARGFMAREQDFERWQRESAASSGDPASAAVAEFDQFLTNHTWIARKLKEKPALANDKGFLDDNAELRQFLNAHPFVQSRFAADPRAFMDQVREFETTGGFGGSDAMRGDLAEFRQFLRNHPWIARKLRENARLANDQDFLSGNRELADFLGAHPALQEALRSNPRAVMDRVR